MTYEEIKEKYTDKERVKDYAVERNVYSEDLDVDALFWYHHKDEMSATEKCVFLAERAIRSWNSQEVSDYGDYWKFELLPDTVAVPVGCIIDLLNYIKGKEDDEYIQLALQIAKSLHDFLDKDVQKWEASVRRSGFEGSNVVWERKYGKAQYSELQLLLIEAERYKRLANDCSYNRFVHEFYAELAKEFAERAYEHEQELSEE